MPDHLHLVAPPGAWPAFRRALTGFTRRFGVRFDLLDAQAATSQPIAGRMVRNGFYNPVRAGFVDDPWCWRWSTLRDLVEAAYPIWTTPSSLGEFLDLEESRLRRTLTFTADLQPAVPTAALRLASTAAIRMAVSAALRIPIDETLRSPRGRRLVIQATFEIAEVSTGTLGAQLGLHRSTIRRARRQRDPALKAVMLCLSDQRLYDPTV